MNFADLVNILGKRRLILLTISLVLIYFGLHVVTTRKLKISPSCFYIASAIGNEIRLGNGKLIMIVI